MLDLLDLNDDILFMLFALFSPPALRAMASTSQKGFQLASRTLVRAVKLSRNPQQVLVFCEFALKHHLCSHIISFTLSESAVYSQPPKDWMKGYLRESDIAECSVFSSALAEVLEGAIRLSHLAFEDCTDVLLKSEPRIADILCHRPPALSLELSSGDISSFQKFGSISGLAHLKLHIINPPKYNRDAEEALNTILGNSIHTLKTLSLGHALASKIRSEHSSCPSWERVHHLTMTGVPLFPAQLTHPFPNLRSLEIIPSRWCSNDYDWKSGSPLPNFQVDCPSHTLWYSLHSFSGPPQLALNLSRHHRLRRLSFMMWGMYSYASELTQLSETARNSDLCSLSLQTQLVELPEPAPQWTAWDTNLIISHDEVANSMEIPPPLLDHLFSTLAVSATRLTYLSLHMGHGLTEIPDCLEYLVRSFHFDFRLSRDSLPSSTHQHGAASLLAPLRNLKYVELGINTWAGPIPGTSFGPVTISVKPEELLRAWADWILSLQYLELNVVTFHEEWEHSWWRIGSQGDLSRTFRQVSEEEGLSARVWFDLEEWK